MSGGRTLLLLWDGNTKGNGRHGCQTSECDLSQNSNSLCPCWLPKIESYVMHTRFAFSSLLFFPQRALVLLVPTRYLAVVFNSWKVEDKLFVMQHFILVMSSDVGKPKRKKQMCIVLATLLAMHVKLNAFWMPTFLFHMMFPTSYSLATDMSPSSHVSHLV